MLCIRRENPDFRLGLGLIEEEKDFRLKRIPKVYDALQGIMKDQAPKEPTQVEKTKTCNRNQPSVSVLAVLNGLSDEATGKALSIRFNAGSERELPCFVCFGFLQKASQTYKLLYKTYLTLPCADFRQTYLAKRI